MYFEEPKTTKVFEYIKVHQNIHWRSVAFPFEKHPHCADFSCLCPSTPLSAPMCQFPKTPLRYFVAGGHALKASKSLFSAIAIVSAETDNSRFLLQQLKTWKNKYFFSVPFAAFRDLPKR